MKVILFRSLKVTEVIKAAVLQGQGIDCYCYIKGNGWYARTNPDDEDMAFVTLQNEGFRISSGVDIDSIPKVDFKRNEIRTNEYLIKLIEEKKIYVDCRIEEVEAGTKFCIELNDDYREYISKHNDKHWFTA